MAMILYLSFFFSLKIGVKMLVVFAIFLRSIAEEYSFEARLRIGSGFVCISFSKCSVRISYQYLSRYFISRP